MPAKDVVTPVASLESLKENDDFTLSCQEALNAVKARQNLRAHFMFLPFPIILFVLFAWAALIHVPIWEMYPAESGLGSALITTGTDAITPNTTTKLKNIRTQADVFAWLTDTLLPAVFVTSDSNEALTSNRIAYYHKLLGAVEFKTWIAKEKDCGLEGSYGMIYNICHDFENPVLDAVFYIDSGATIEEAKEFIVARQDEGTWLNQSTAVLQINVATYNGELDLMGVTSLILTFQSGGYIKTEYKMAVIPADPYHSNHTGLVLDIIIGVFVIATIIFQSKLAYDRFRAKMPYWDFWRLIEWVSMGAIIVFYILWIILCSVIYNENLSSELLTLEVSGTYDFSKESDLEEAGPLLTDIMDRMRSMGSLVVAVRLVGLASLFLLIVRVLGSLRFHPRLNIVTATLGAALNSLQPFFFVFVICLAAFVTSGCLLFGEKLEQFSTIGYTTVTVVNMLFGQFDLEAVFEVDYLIALVWYWCTMIVLFLVLFNMLLAIVLAAFDQVRDVNSDAPSRSVRKEFSIIAKELIGVDRFLHGKANKRFRQSVQNGSLQNLTHVSSRSLCEHLEIDDKEAKNLMDKLKVLSRAGADLNQNKVEGKKTNDESDEDDIKSLQEKIERLEQTIDKLVAHLDKSS
ncbi:unnamed protein product [Aphanomyces euteiches]|nr:hypothetical protein AeRB84_018753 [Aphanomyces euteiches]